MLFIKKRAGSDQTYTQQELEAIDQLTALLEENDSDNLSETIDLETILAEVECAISTPSSVSSSFKSSKKKFNWY